MLKKVLLVLVLFVGLSLLVWSVSNQSATLKSLTKTDPSPTSSVPSKEAVSAKLATLERGWVKNEGQWDERALFSAPGYFGTTWITKDGELLHVAIKKEECEEKACPSKSWVISEHWVGGKVQAIKGEEELQTKVSYFVGNDPSKHKTNLPTYRYVSLGEVWSGVEVKLKATQKTVEKLFYVKPGADPSKIVVEVGGAKGLRLSKNGEIIIKTGLGDLKLSKPVAWQEKDGKKLPVEVSYKLVGKNRYSFVVAKADPSLPIVIDPILQSTYLSGSNDDSAEAIAVNPATGDVYVAGVTYSTDFPNTIGGARGSSGGNGDAFVARLNPDLTLILQSTYLGGSYEDRATALAVNPKTGDVYVVGNTLSPDFPKATGWAQGNNNGGLDAFVARLNSSLTQLLQSTYLGGSGWDEALAIAVNPTTGDVYVAGNTLSTDFPKTASGAQSIKSLGSDAFVSRLNSNLTRIFQSTYLGGSGLDEALAITIHPTTGDVYVAGRTSSTNFPGTNGGAQASNNGGSDAFVAKLNPNLTKILQSTYLGGGDDDEALAIAVHPTTGEIYVAGTTLSSDFPKIAGGARENKSGGSDAFVSRLNSSLTQILQSTYLGGEDDDEALAIAVHPTTGEIYVAGRTASTNFPGTNGGAQAGNNGGFDAFVARLNPNLTKILQSTYLGGGDDDEALAIAVHPTTGEIYVAGTTLSSNFPKIAGGARENKSGGSDAFVSRLSSGLNQESPIRLPGRRRLR